MFLQFNNKIMNVTCLKSIFTYEYSLVNGHQSMTSVPQFLNLLEIQYDCVVFVLRS